MPNGVSEEPQTIEHLQLIDFKNNLIRRNIKIVVNSSNLETLYVRNDGVHILITKIDVNHYLFIEGLETIAEFFAVPFEQLEIAMRKEDLKQELEDLLSFEKGDQLKCIVVPFADEQEPAANGSMNGNIYLRLHKILI